MTTELTQILIDSQNPDPSVRRTAEAKLLTAEQNNFAAYVTGLARELEDDTKSDIVRQLAGIVLKNAISGTDPLIDKLKREKWIQLTDSVANDIRKAVLTTLTCTSEVARLSACQVISKTGRLDLLLSRWPTLLNSLMQLICNNEAPIPHRRGAVTALGYLSEDVYLLSQESGTDLLAREQKNVILTTITHAIRSEDKDLGLAGCKALYHALLFAKENMSHKMERDFIFQVVASCLEHADLDIQHAGWECVLQIATEYYIILDDYASDLGKHSIATVKTAMAVLDQPGTTEELRRRSEAVALAALELWNSLCDVEISIALEEVDTEEEKISKHYIAQAKDVLLPVLFEAMTKQETDASENEEWTLAMAAGTCVGLCAQVLGDDILDPALEFVTENFGDPDWKRREAAVLAYGSIMEGPTSQRLEVLVKRSFTHLCNALNDESVAVRDTTAWTIGRIAAFHTRCIVELLGTPTSGGLMNLLLQKLEDEPRVAAFVCYALHEIARNIRDLSLVDTADSTLSTRLDPFFRQIVSALLNVAQKNDAIENNLRASAFEALSEVIRAVGGTEYHPVMAEVLHTLSTWLQRSFAAAPTEEIFQLQGLICGCLNNLIERLGTSWTSAEICSAMFELFAKVIEIGLSASAGTTNNQSSGVEGLGASEERTKVGSEEDAMLAIGSLIRSYGQDFHPHLGPLSQILIQGLRTPNDVRFCRACIGVICEIATSMDLHSATTRPIIDQLIPELYKILQDSSAPISLKPALITTVGDIVIAMEGDFEPNLEPFLQLLGHAASTQVSDGPMSEEWIEYFQDLRDSILEASSGIIHGLRVGSKLNLLKAHVNNWLTFIQSIIEDPNSSLSNISKATEVTGDLVTCYRHELVTHLVALPFYKVMLEKGQTSDDEELRQRTNFLKTAVHRCGAK